MKRTIRVGTRSSKLALAQTRIVTELIGHTSPSVKIEVVPTKTRGDTLPLERKATFDEKEAFTGDLEEMLSRGEVDIAVHSLKDMPNKLGPGLTIGAVPARGDPRDALVSAFRLSKLPKGAKIGTSSLRRRVQLLRLSGDLKVVSIHGNVPTRIGKMDQLGLDGLVLAAAGLSRIGEVGTISQRFSINQMVPAVGQGIIAVEARGDDKELGRVLRKTEDPGTRAAAECERAFSLRLGGDCHVPIGAHARPEGRSIKVVGFIASVDGKDFVKRSIVGKTLEARALGERLGDELLRIGGDQILKAS